MIESNKLQIAAIFELGVISHPEQNLMDFEQGENELMLFFEHFFLSISHPDQTSIKISSQG